LQKALGLPKESRAFMVEKLLQSLDHGEAFAIDPEWMRCVDGAGKSMRDELS